MPSVSFRLFAGAARRRLLTGAILGLALASTTAQAQNPSSPTPVRFEEAVRSILYVPLYAALSKGFFKEAGLDVTMKTSQGTDKGMTALLTGSADIVLIGPEASVYVQNSESPVKPRIFAGLTATDGFLLLSREPRPDFQWDQVKGKEIIGFRPGSNPLIFLEAALRKHNVDPKSDVKLLNNIGIPARAGAWLSGQGDFGIFLEPEAGDIVRAGKGHIVASIGDVVGPVDYTSFTATDTYIAKHPAVIQAWTDVTARALKYVQETPSATLATDIAPFFPGLKPDAIVPAIDRYKQYGIWKQQPRVEPQAMDQLQDMLVASGVLEPARRVPHSTFVITEFADKAR